MPKVSQQYRDARRQQILSAARRCFLRSGFHETSMQDLFAEAGLSSGSVYLYFAGKDDIMLAIAEENMREVLALLHGLADQPHADGIGAAVADVLSVVRRKHEESQLGPMSVLVWAEALRNPKIAGTFNESLTQMRADLAEAVRSYQAAGSLPRDASADAVAKLLIAIVPGVILQLALFGTDDVAGMPEAVAAVWP